MNYVIRHPKGKVAPPSRPPLVRVRRWLLRATGAVERFVRRLRVRMAARSMVAPARRWWAKPSTAIFVQRLSYLAFVIVVVWVAEGLYGMFTHRKSPMQNFCEQGGSNGCTVVYGFLAPFLSIGLATGLFLVVQYFSVRRPLNKAAKKEPRRLVPTAGPTMADVVGRKEVCLVIARALRDRRTRRPYLLVGGVGAGKTSVLVQLTELLARKGVTPVPVRLRDAEVDGSRLDFHEMGMKRFAELVDRGVLSSHQSERVWRQLCIDDKVVILADGLEETFAEGEEQKERDIQIRHAIDRARRQKLPLVIASRPHSPLENTQAAIIDLEPLSEEAALEYLEKDSDDPDDHRLDWIVETACVAESPLYLQIARQLRDSHLLDHLGGAKRSEKLNTRDSDRAGLRLQLLETWRSALRSGHVRGNVALSSEDRETTIEVISALAGIGLLQDRLEVRFDELIGKDHDNAESRFPGVWERLSERLRGRCPVKTDLHRCRVLLALCATQGEQLGLVEAHGNRVRFPHSIIQAYLGSGYFDVSRCELLAKALEEPGPGRELLIGLVLRSRADRDDPRWGAVEWRDVIRRLLRAAEERTDPKALEMYAAALEIDQIRKGAELQAIARSVLRRWKWIRAGDPRTIEGAKLTLVHRFGEVLRAIADAEPGDDIADRVRKGYDSLFSIATVEPSYPIRLAIAQEVGAGGDQAFDALRIMFPLPPKEEMSLDDDPWVQYERATRDESYREHRTREFYLRQMAGNDQLREQYAKCEKNSAERRAEIWRKFVIRAWLVPLMAESVGEAHRSQAKERVRLWLGHLEPERTHSHHADLPLSLEIALAQGFKSAANRRRLHPHVNEEAREFLIAQAEDMLAHARSWAAQLILIQALCLWELPDSTTRSGPRTPGRIHSRKKADPVRAVRRWLEMSGTKRDTDGRNQDEDRTPEGDRLHPFVAEAASLAVLALQSGHPERFVWIDEMGTVGNIGSSPAEPGAYRKHNLWIPPSVGWSTLHPRAQQLLADVILLLNLTERDGENVDELEVRLKRANRPVLPPCLTKDRRTLDPRQTVGMAENAPPGSACLRDCPFELCPYPAMGSLPRAEVRETFCRQQQALLRPYRRLSYANPLSWVRRKRAPWQGMTCKELRGFWEDMAIRSRTPSSSTFSLQRKGIDMADREKTLHVRVTAADEKTLRTTLREERPDIGGGPRRTGGPGDEVSIEAYVTEEKALNIDGREGVTVHVLRDATATGRARQAEVGTGNRFAAPDAVPHGLGEKTKDEKRER